MASFHVFCLCCNHACWFHRIRCMSTTSFFFFFCWVSKRKASTKCCLHGPAATVSMRLPAAIINRFDIGNSHSNNEYWSRTLSSLAYQVVFFFTRSLPRYSIWEILWPPLFILWCQLMVFYYDEDYLCYRVSVHDDLSCELPTSHVLTNCCDIFNCIHPATYYACLCCTLSVSLLWCSYCADASAVLLWYTSPSRLLLHVPSSVLLSLSTRVHCNFTSLSQYNY
jgi:hypothetical protein